MKIIFLDFDGVLNSDATRQKEPWRSEKIMFIRRLDPDHVAVLNEVIKQTGSKVVVSSTWRHFHSLADLAKILEQAGFVGEVVGVTDKLWGEIPGSLTGERFERGHEIRAWLDENAGIDGFVVIDDSTDMATVTSHLVRTKTGLGLLAEHIPSILRALSMKVSA